MVILSNTRKKALFVTMVLLVSYILPNFVSVNSASAYSYYCKTEACHAAEDAYNAAIKALEQANSEINTLKGEIAALEAENRSLEASIKADRAIVEDLKTQIIETENKITNLKTGLASIIINSHFDTSDKDVITILASSKTISDIAEKHSRENTVKDQIALYSEEIEDAKNELEAQKVTAENKVAEQEAKQAQIAANKEIIKQKLSGAQATANSAQNQANNQKAIVDAAKKAAMEAQQGSSGVSVYINGYYDTYPYHYSCPGGIDSRSVIGGYMCECVSYTGWKVQEAYGVSIYSWGNALDWDTSARRSGFRVDNEPEAGSVAVSHYGGYGHVMWVENVHGDGTIDITEYNYNYGSFSARRIPIYGNYGYSNSWQNYSAWNPFYTRYSPVQPWDRGYGSTKDYLYFIHFK